jgi:putative mRNA 3-end processing factor
MDEMGCPKHLFIAQKLTTFMAYSSYLAMMLEFREQGMYCPQGDFYIDPWRTVPKALITHGHSDHARWGHGQYIATHLAIPVLRHRLGDIQVMGVDYGQTLMINDVKVSFHPAGHIIGSAQIRLEYRGEIWVISGDYKLGDDGLSTPFEPVRCHSFITESTFGLPSFRWEAQENVYADIHKWWQQNAALGRPSVIACYALGKAQRILTNLSNDIGPIYTHGSIENTQAILRAQGFTFAHTEKLTVDVSKTQLSTAMIVAPPSALGSPWIDKIGDYSDAVVSGWMQVRGIRRRRNVQRGFVLSDHADWPELLTAIRETDAHRIFVTHGYSAIMSRYLTSVGYDAHVVSTEWDGDEATTDPQEAA